MRETTVDNKKDNRFEILKELLLTDDRQKFESLRDQFLEKDKIRENINPVVDEKIDDLKANFPEHFGDQITQSIKVQFRESQDEVVEALYPIMGKLVKKFIIAEIPFIIHKENDEDDIENSENSGYKSIEGKKVLVADDNFLNLTIVSHILTKEKTDFTLVKDGVEALNALEKTKFDIVLLDINMPNLTGEELIKRKKELNQDNSKTPFLALTGNNSKDDIEGYKNIGFEDVIPKPFTAVQFVETIKKYL
ncbi:response regulator [Polaribacter sp.]|uniref:response regulator n=1 Tax=Polaribacter sp. TaxID=1920175 RepID=UPI003F6A34C7